MANRAGTIYWQGDDFDPDNVLIQIFGYGIVNHQGLIKDIARTFKQLDKELSKNGMTNNTKYYFYEKKSSSVPLIKIAALAEVEEELEQPKTKRKLTILRKKKK